MKRFLGFLTMMALAAYAVSCNAPEGPVEKAPIKVDLGNNTNNDVSDKVENKEIKQPVNVKNI